MPAERNKENKHTISDIKIGKLIQWEEHCILTSHISQIWIGSLPGEVFPVKTFTLLLFIALSAGHIFSLIAMLALSAFGATLWFYRHRQKDAKKQVHVKLHTGDVFSFSAKNEEALEDFYDAIKKTAEGSFVSEIIFDTEGRIEKKPEAEVPPETDGILKINGENTRNDKLIDELKQLYKGYEEKTETNGEIIQLINGTASFMASDDRDGLKKCFQKFVTLGLIDDCNELGLDSLIQEIKSSVY